MSSCKKTQSDPFPMLTMADRAAVFTRFTWADPAIRCAPVEKGGVVKPSSCLISCVVGLGFVLGAGSAVEAAPATTRESRIKFVRPELPRVTVDTTLPQQRGKVTRVPAEKSTEKSMPGERTESRVGS